MAIVIGSNVSAIGHSADYSVGLRGRHNLIGGGRAGNTPWATLQYAEPIRVKPGDNVHVLDGGYSGFYLTKGGHTRATDPIHCGGQSQ